MIGRNQLLLRMLTGLMLLAGASVCCARSAAQEAKSDTDWVNAGREAFADGAYPWYDDATDSLKPIEIEKKEERDIEWLSKLLGAIIKIAAYLLLALALAALVFVLIHFFRTRQAREQRAGTVKDSVKAADQVEALPFLAERPRGDLLGEARRHYEAGNYSEAIIYLFSYELLELDKFSFIRLAKGKTNRQYLREVGRAAAVRSPLELTLVTFESVFFGRRSLDRDGFEACWRQLPEFEQHLRAAT